MLFVFPSKTIFNRCFRVVFGGFYNAPPSLDEVSVHIELKNRSRSRILRASCICAMRLSDRDLFRSPLLPPIRIFFASHVCVILSHVTLSLFGERDSDVVVLSFFRL